MGTFRVLNNGVPACIDDMAEPRCPIFVGSGKHNTYQAGAEDLRGALKQYVNGWTRIENRIILRKRKASVRLNTQVIVGRGEVNVTLFNRLIVFSFPDRNIAFPVKSSTIKLGRSGGTCTTTITERL